MTELPNRALFLDRLQSALKRSLRGNLRLAVMYLDMDNFKLVNDAFGHRVGDLLLHEVAQRLRLCVRDSDTIGRLGGDEFAILLEDISNLQDAAMIAEKVLAALSAPYLLDGQTLTNAPSLGIAVYPVHGQERLPKSTGRYGGLATQKNPPRHGKIHHHQHSGWCGFPKPQAEPSR